MQSTSICTDNTPASVTTQPPPPSITPNDRIWANLLNEAFIGDVVACLSIKEALALDESSNQQWHEVTNAMPVLPETFSFVSLLRNHLVIVLYQEEIETPYTKMPDDFIPLVRTLKPKVPEDPTPLDDRFQHLSVLDRRQDGAQGSVLSGISIEDFERRLQCLRMATLKWGNSEMEKYFVQELNRQYPHLRVLNHPLNSSADFCEWIKQGIWDNEKRAIVDFASHTMWGDNNQWAINQERRFTKMLQIQFTGYKANGAQMNKMHQGKCAAAIFVKSKGCLVTKIRNTCKRRWKEAVYSRNEEPKIADEESVESGQSSENSVRSENKRKVPILLHQEVANVETHGFTGIVGYCEGHPKLAVLKAKKSPKSVVDVAATTDDHTAMSALTAGLSLCSTSVSEPKSSALKIEAFLSKCDAMTISDLKRILLEKPLEKASEAQQQPAEHQVGL
jgi:hypothetical protein